jgi:hypothetical protein
MRKRGGIRACSGYGWIANQSITGRLRPLSRYALPRSRMKRVGEWVGRAERGLSLPRGASDPPITIVAGAAALIAS